MTLQEILERKAEIKNIIRTRSAELSLEEIQNFNKELDNLDKEEKKIRAKQELDKKLESGSVEVIEKAKKGDSPVITLEQRAKQERAKRGSLYKSKLGTPVQLRSTVEGTTQEGILIPSHLERTVDAFPWNEVNSVVDLVTVIDLPNGSEYTKAFQIETGEGAYTLEPTKTGTDTDDGKYAEVETKFDQVTIKRNKITAITYESEELDVLPDADYASLVESNVSLSLKKKLAKEIILGDGTGNHFVGIACSVSDNLNTNTYDNKEYAIDENVLLDMMVDYGGDEDVESKQVIVMNKLSLKTFYRIRGENKTPIFNISVTGNTFTIDGHRGVFTSHLKPYDKAISGEIWAVYGDFSKYIMLNFGGETIETAKEFKFDQGVTAVRGKVYSGGGMAGYKAFLRATKPTTTV